MSLFEDYDVPLLANFKNQTDMEVISIERQYLRGNRLAASLVEELLTSFNSFVTKMKEMAK